MRRRDTLLAAVATAGLSACGTLPRETFALTGAPQGEPLGIGGVRAMRGEAGRLDTAGILAERAKSAPLSILALSGGGANGSYGAGVLVGWTEAGTRPSFDLVTGVSTGALTAPFAFLGGAYDKGLTDAYAGGASKGLLSMRRLSPFRSPGLFSAAPLRSLVGRFLDRSILDAVAAEHAKGRRLLVATTNLDAEASVLWDLGAIASNPGDKALELFGDVLVASASIPGVFPPVMIPLQGADGTFREMHVDGAVASLFFSLPEGVLGSAALRGKIHLVVNGKAEPGFAVTKGNTAGVLGRSYETLRKSAVNEQLSLLSATARARGLSVEAAAIPRSLDAGSVDFSGETMTRLFDAGRAASGAGRAFAPVA